ncbi:ferrochelatase [Candidatus Sumerlaeota bacterium]|nr:ferrochelatase [Candidatus Sumerlaeota bacterium]
MNQKSRRIKVVCLTYGEPWGYGLWEQIKYSYSILRRLTLRVAPIPRPIPPYIALKRGWGRRKMFAAINYHSPLEKITARQVELLQERLSALHPDAQWECELVREFRPPYLKQKLAEWARNPPDELLLLPMYMSDSDFTGGISRTDLHEFHVSRNGAHPLPPPRYVLGFGYDEQLAELMACYIEEHCERHGWDEARCRKSILILGAHGTIVTLPDSIPNGADELMTLAKGVRRRLMQRFAKVRIGWLNHQLGGKWTQPDVTESARRAQRDGIRHVVYFPFGFMADNNETQNEGKAALSDFEWDDALYLPCLNADPRFIEILARKTIERLGQPAEKWEAVDPSQGRPKPR